MPTLKLSNIHSGYRKLEQPVQGIIPKEFNTIVIVMWVGCASLRLEFGGRGWWWWANGAAVDGDVML